MIRPLERQDLPEVARLYELVMPRQEPASIAENVAFFERTLLDQPWADSEIPSLLSVDGAGRITGFLGSHVRRVLLGGEPIRVGYVGHLMAAPDVRRPVGTLLLRRYLAGPQDASLTDSGGEPTRRMWEGLHGRLLPVRAIVWTRVFRPWALAADGLRTLGRAPAVARALAGSAPSLDRVTAGPARRLVGVSSPRTASEPLTTEALLSELTASGGAYRIRLAYDKTFLDWLWAELDRLRPDTTCVRRLVRDERGSVLGWYVYLLRRDRMSRVLQVAGRSVAPVLEDMMSHARNGGAAALHGRLEPNLPQPLYDRRRAPLAYRGGALAHARRPELLTALEAPDSLLTRLDGDWCSPPPE